MSQPEKMMPNQRLELIKEWSVFMKTSSTWNIKSITGKVMMGLVLAAMIGSMDVAPAIGRDDYRRVEKQNNNRNEHRGRGNEHRRPVQKRRAYIPPRVIYEPPPPPGFGIFFPPIFIHR
jgi:hypothetical protein